MSSLETNQNGNRIDRQYKLVPEEEIENVGPVNPQAGIAMLLVNARMEQARDQASLARPHEPTLHEYGWTITIETSKGPVLLWSSDVGTRFHLNYPADVTAIPNQVIKDSLGVEDAKPVASEIHGQMQWAPFFSPRIGEDQGRVWIRVFDAFLSPVPFSKIVDNRTLEQGYRHEELTRGIFNFDSSLYSTSDPDGPNGTYEAIAPYREKFLDLTVRIVNHLGGAAAVVINYGFVLVPEQLESLGYENITWLKGKPGVREGWNNELVSAEKATASGKEIIMLQSGNSMVPWSAIRKVECGEGGVTAEALKELLTF